MSDRDDFLDQGGERFDPDADEFQIPEDPHGDDSSDDFLGQPDDEFDLGGDDVLDETGQSDDFFLEDDDSGAINLDEIDEHAIADETDTERGEGDDEYYEEDEPEQGSASLGWKAWTALGLATVVMAGGITYAFLPDFGGSRPQQAERLPEPPPAPPEPPAPSQGGGSGSDASMPAPMVADSSEQTEQQPSTAQIGQPLTVDPFPRAQEVPERQEMVQQPARVPEIEQVPAQELERPVAQLEAPEPIRDVPQEIEVTPFELDAPQESVGSVAQPQRAQAADPEPQYAQNLVAERAAFEMLMDLTRQYGAEIDEVRGSLNDHQAQTSRQVSDLDTRVDRLEKMMSEKEKNTREREQANQPRQTEAKQVSTASDAQAPKTPAEVERVQRILKEYGYRPGLVDGILGGQTRWAIKRLQEEHGLPVTGWLDKQTRDALANPKRYSGTYPEEKQPADRRVASGEMSRQENARVAFGNEWFVRGVTPVKAIVYRPDGASYTVRVGTEIPGMGQVTQLDPENLHVVTANGVITLR